MEQAFLGTGWTFPVQVSVQGGIQLSSASQDIREAMWIILRTSHGERVYRPDFGSRLSELVFAPLNTETLFLVQLYVREALERWETRIILDRVLADPDPVRGILEIEISYRIKGYPDPQSLIYPFYLGPTSEG